MIPLENADVPDEVENGIGDTGAAVSAQLSAVPERHAFKHDDIEEIPNRPTLWVEDQVSRIEDPRHRLGTGEELEVNEDYAPLKVQITNALSMLAEGGHTYAPPGDGEVFDQEAPAEAARSDAS